VTGMIKDMIIGKTMSLKSSFMYFTPLIILSYLFDMKKTILFAYLQKNIVFHRYLSL
jgi:hypothetical protein